MEAQDLEFFEEFIDSYQDEYDVGFRRIAATLVYLLQKEKPLQHEGPAEEPEVEVAPAPRSAKSAGGAGMRRYRIEVGRVHGVEPRHIVGAITNEAQISSGDIGAIKLFHEFSLVDLPQKMPHETFSLLQDVWVCGQQLKLSVDTGPGEARQEKHPGKRTFGKGGEQPRFKPGGRKPPHTRRGK
jgi:ATP-dependent RNA helicase DeaD